MKRSPLSRSWAIRSRRLRADVSGRWAINWVVYDVPESYLVGAVGRIAFKHVGLFARQILDEGILPVVAGLQAGGFVK